MPRVHTVEKARKNYPNYGIKKGDKYYWWKFRYGGKVMSKTYPKPSQLTQSGYLSQLYDIQDRLASITNGIGDASDLAGAVTEIVSELESLKEETESSLEQMPEHLRDTSTSGELLTSRIEALDSAIDELNGLTLDDFEEDGDQELEDWLSDKQSEIDNISLE